jgi:hypothetical protein
MIRVLIPLLAAAPLILSADTLMLRDGTQRYGTFVSGSPRQIVMTENGQRRVYDVRNVQQLTFGSDPYASDNRAGAPANDSPFYEDRFQALSRLRNDVDDIVASYDLNGPDRARMQRIASSLHSAESALGQNRRDSIDRAELRTAMQDLRVIAREGWFEDADNRRLTNDLDALRLNRGNDSYGTRSRTEANR